MPNFNLPGQNTIPNPDFKRTYTQMLPERRSFDESILFQLSTFRTIHSDPMSILKQNCEMQLVNESFNMNMFLQGAGKNQRNKIGNAQPFSFLG